MITVLAQQAPDLHDALRRATDAGASHVILDGKVFSCDRYSEKTLSVKGEPIDLWYSGKAHEHGGNIQALSAPNGFPLWVSAVEPGSVHDLTAAREHVLGALCWAASQLGLPTLADGGYDGAGIGVHTPVKQPAGDQCSTWTTAPTTRCYGACGAWASVGSPCSPGRWRALRHITASHARSVTSSKPHWR